MIRAMRRTLALLILAAGCSSTEEAAPAAYTTGARAPNDMAPAPLAEPSPGSPSAAKDAGDLEPWNGKEVSLSGVFESDRAIHGVVRLASGLRIWIPHFEHYGLGADWLVYVGKPCVVGGTLHTYTRDVDGYRQPRLEIREFSGTRE